MNMIKKMMIGMVLVATVFTGNAAAWFAPCLDVEIIDVSVNGNNETYPEYKNIVTLKLNKGCQNSEYAVFSMGDPAANFLLSAALTALSRGESVNVYVNTGTLVAGSPQVASIALQK